VPGGCLVAYATYGGGPANSPGLSIAARLKVNQKRDVLHGIWTSKRAMVNEEARHSARGKLMLGYVSFGIGLSVIVVILIFIFAWSNLYEEVRYTSQLLEEFYSTIRRLIVSIGVAVIPAGVYLIETKGQSAYNVAPYAFVWIACYVVALLFLAQGLIILIRDAKRGKKTGLYRFRR
jgi:hypothetical protein